MTSKDPELEYSDFSGDFTDDDVTVHVSIYRIAHGLGDGWALEVIDSEQASTVWEEPFATDRAAFDEFLATIERDGIRSFLEDRESDHTIQ